MKEWIAYVGPFSFPWGQAASRRVYGNAVSLLGAGFDVTVACGNPVSPLQVLEINEATRSTLTWCGVDELKSERTRVAKLCHHLLLTGRATASWLGEQSTLPKYVIVYGGLSTYSLHVLAWCRRHAVPIIVDLVEWYDPTQMLGGRFGPFYASACFAMRYVYPKFDGAIVISKYLEQAFQNLCPVVRIPPTVASLPKPVDSVTSQQELRLVYAGVPGKKDLLGVIIKAVLNVFSQNYKLCLTIVGVTQKDLEKANQLSGPHPAVRALGRIPQMQVLEQLQAADFSVLLREAARFTNAGFPTKFVESMVAGTPVICNITSDLGDFLHHGKNGLIVESTKLTDLEKVLVEAANLTSMQRKALKEEAMLTAKASFQSKLYSEDFEKFLKQTSKHRQLKRAKSMMR